MKSNILPFGRMTNSSLNACVDNSLQIIVLSEIEELNSNEYVVALKETHQRFVQSLSKRIFNEYIQELNDSYSKVCLIISLFRNSTELLTKSKVPADKALAERILNHFRSLDRNWNKVKRKEQKGYLINLITEFSQPDYLTPMTATPLLDIFNQIKIAADEYSVALKNCNDDNELIKSVESSTVVRVPLISCYNDVYWYIDSMCITTKGEQWKKLLASIDVLHEKELIKLRAKQTNADKALEQSRNQSTPLADAAGKSSTSVA